MSSRVVAGVPLPLPLGNHPALDFCNTRAGWYGPEPKEYLIHPRALTLWACESALITAAEARDLLVLAERRPVIAESVLQRALQLREALYPVSLGRGGTREWDVVAGEAAAARACSRLVAGAEAGTPASWQSAFRTADGSPRIDAAVLAIATAAGELLTGRLAGSVSACPRPDCGWLFSDPRGRRRWCSMEVCGNRAKASRYRGNRADKRSDSGA
jgi:predicted RNA-binding Zn ribbon-like protein